MKDNRVEKRDRVHDIILKKESEVEDFFKLSNYYDKKKILKIFSDDYLSYLFDELVMRRQILLRDEFLSFLKRKYCYKYDFTNTNQAITLTSIFFNKFKNKIKIKFVSAVIFKKYF